MNIFEWTNKIQIKMNISHSNKNGISPVSTNKKPTNEKKLNRCKFHNENRSLSFSLIFPFRVTHFIRFYFIYLTKKRKNNDLDTIILYCLFWILTIVEQREKRLISELSSSTCFYLFRFASNRCFRWLFATFNRCRRKLIISKMN